jgi:hypothetical protein
MRDDCGEGLPKVLETGFEFDHFALLIAGLHRDGDTSAATYLEKMNLTSLLNPKNLSNLPIINKKESFDGLIDEIVDVDLNEGLEKLWLQLLSVTFTSKPVLYNLLTTKNTALRIGCQIALKSMSMEIYLKHFEIPLKGTVTKSYYDVKDTDKHVQMTQKVKTKVSSLSKFEKADSSKFILQKSKIKNTTQNFEKFWKQKWSF